MEFDNGRVRGAPEPAPLSGVRHGAEDGFPRTASIMPRPLVGSVPFNKSYGELTPAQQAAVKSQYRALEKGDEPPYPIHGLQRAQAKALVTGKQRIDVLVGKDGNPVTLKTIGAPSPEIARFATVVMAQEKYKPAVCHGAPCDMVFPFCMEFIVK